MTRYQLINRLDLKLLKEAKLNSWAKLIVLHRWVKFDCNYHEAFGKHIDVTRAYPMIQNLRKAGLVLGPTGRILQLGYDVAKHLDDIGFDMTAENIYIFPGRQVMPVSELRIISTIIVNGPVTRNDLLSHVDMGGECYAKEVFSRMLYRQGILDNISTKRSGVYTLSEKASDLIETLCEPA